MPIDKAETNYRTVFQFPVATFIWINGLEEIDIWRNVRADTHFNLLEL